MSRIEVSMAMRSTRTISRFAIGLCIAALLQCALQPAQAQSVKALPSIDLNRFTGTWYEIARLPNKREKKCIADVVQVLALGDKKNQLQIVESCKTNKGYTQIRNASAKGLKNSGDGKLKVTYLWPFSEKHWVLALGEQYEWALVGSPDHKTLWVLSRTRNMDNSTLSAIQQKAGSQGFHTDKMKMTAQSGS